MNNNLTESLQDYIEVIYIILLEKPICRVKDIEQKTNVSKPSIVQALSLLKEKKLINKEKYGYITLTDKGEKIAKDIYNKHIEIKNFLMFILKLKPEHANEIACGIEHHIDKETLNNIKNINETLKKRSQITIKVKK